MGEDRPYAGSYSGGNAGYLRMADHYCVHAEGDLVHFVPDSAVRCDMIDYEEVVEAIWRYDCPRIDIDEDITTLYADGKPFAQVIHRADGSREDLYFEDYELQKDILIKPNATLRDVVELCMNGDISYADAREWYHISGSCSKCYYENLSGKGCGDKKCSKERMIFSLS